MFEGFETRDIETSGATIHLRHAGEGPPLLLLHGNPLTHVSWHKIASRLAEHFHVVATDLRGYGDSSAPPTDEKHAPYTFRAMAQDQLEVMEAFVSRAWAMKSWHWLFMAQPAPLPERMMGGIDARSYMEGKLSKPGIGLAHFAEEAFDEYVRCFDEKTIFGSCEDYRACATTDLEMDTEDVENGVTYGGPTLVVWGARSHTGTVHGDLLPIWKRWCPNVQGGPIDCGHYTQEEAPDEVYDWFMRFFPA